jgi:hypothetical protein
MSHGNKQDELKRTAHQAFVAEESVRQAARRADDEDERQASASAKIARLRAQREARDVAEEAAKALPKAKPVSATPRGHGAILRK